jgi:putative FmdB family regulatory protein
MPLYEYKCSKCSSLYEVIQKIDEPPLKKCLKCGAPVFKVISAPALQFKGSGWYITDYAQKKKAPSKAEKSTTPAESSVKTENKKSPPSSSKE